MRFTCPSCQSSYRLSRDRLGPTAQAKIKCPSCKSLVRVRATDDNKLEATMLKESGAHAPMQVAAPAAKQQPSVTRATHRILHRRRQVRRSGDLARRDRSQGRGPHAREQAG